MTESQVTSVALALFGALMIVRLRREAPRRRHERRVRLAVLGDPLAYTLSPVLHRAGCEALGLAVRVAARCARRPRRWRERLRDLAARGFRGCNLTHPLKEHALDHVDRASVSAERARARSTRSRSRPTGWWGETTDGPGFVDLLRRAAARARREQRVVLLGRGRRGAQPRAGARMGRLPRRARERAPRRATRSFTWGEGPDTRFMGWRSAEEDDALRGASVVVNCTPLSGTEPPAPLSLASGDALVVDLTYGPELTPWVRAARAAGLQAIDGLGLLVHQARRSLSLWLGREVPRGTARRRRGLAAMSAGAALARACRGSALGAAALARRASVLEFALPQRCPGCGEHATARARAVRGCRARDPAVAHAAVRALPRSRAASRWAAAVTPGTACSRRGSTTSAPPRWCTRSSTARAPPWRDPLGPHAGVARCRPVAAADLVLEVPLHPARRARTRLQSGRGAGRRARRARSASPRLPRALAPRARHAPQARLGEAARRANVEGAFARSGARRASRAARAARGRRDDDRRDARGRPRGARAPPARRPPASRWRGRSSAAGSRKGSGERSVAPSHSRRRAAAAGCGSRARLLARAAAGALGRASRAATGPSRSRSERARRHHARGHGDPDSAHGVRLLHDAGGSGRRAAGRRRRVPGDASSSRVILALLGQGGFTVIGLNTLVLGRGRGARAAALPARSRRRSPAGAMAAATAISQLFSSALWIGVLVLAVRLAPRVRARARGRARAWSGSRAERCSPCSGRCSGWRSGIEALLGYGLAGFLDRVRPDLLPGRAAAARPPRRVRRHDQHLRAGRSTSPAPGARCGIAPARSPSCVAALAARGRRRVRAGLAGARSCCSLTAVALVVHRAPAAAADPRGGRPPAALRARLRGGELGRPRARRRCELRLRPVIASLVALWLVGTTPYPDLFAPLSRVLPRALGDGLFLTYRAVFALARPRRAAVEARSSCAARSPGRCAAGSSMVGEARGHAWCCTASSAASACTRSCSCAGTPAASAAAGTGSRCASEDAWVLALPRVDTAVRRSTSRECSGHERAHRPRLVRAAHLSRPHVGAPVRARLRGRARPARRRAGPERLRQEHAALPHPRAARRRRRARCACFGVDPARQLLQDPRARRRAAAEQRRADHRAHGVRRRLVLARATTATPTPRWTRRSPRR